MSCTRVQLSMNRLDNDSNGAVVEVIHTWLIKPSEKLSASA